MKTIPISSPRFSASVRTYRTAALAEVVTAAGTFQVVYYPLTNRFKWKAGTPAPLTVHQVQNAVYAAWCKGVTP